MPLKVDKTIWQTSGEFHSKNGLPNALLEPRFALKIMVECSFWERLTLVRPTIRPILTDAGGRTALVCCFLREILEFERKACNYVMWVFIVSNLLHNFIFLKLQPFSFSSFHLFLKLQPFIFSSFHLFWNYNLSSFHLFIFSETTTLMKFHLFIFSSFWAGPLGRLSSNPEFQSLNV